MYQNVLNHNISHPLRRSMMLISFYHIFLTLVSMMFPSLVSIISFSRCLWKILTFFPSQLCPNLQGSRSAPCLAMGRTYRVTGGASNGLLVRQQRALSSTACAERLRHGSVPVAAAATRNTNGVVTCCNTRRIHGAGIYANIWGILMVNVISTHSILQLSKDMAMDQYNTYKNIIF